MSNKDKRDSALIKTVVALDNHLAELERIGTKINAVDMTAAIDMDHVQKLMTRFAECGQEISKQVADLSTQLQEAQGRAEVVAQDVSRQAVAFKIRREEQNEKLEQFRVLGEKVQALNAAIREFRPPKGAGLTKEDRAKLTANVPGYESQLVQLIEELRDLRQSARNSRMKSLDKGAESLVQTLQIVRKKLADISS